ncbi:MAG: phage antirepressor N-terminal domain-containing protein [Roseiflexaceae bacterium]|nr:phage antirepressor N-terminal domain-containing protein [Roseiflexaceae bacterium]
MHVESAQIPGEQLPITLFDGVVLAVRAADGNIYLVLRDLCTALDLVFSSQLRSIRADDRLHVVAFRLRIGNQVRTQECLLLDDIPLWLIKVRPSRHNDAAATRLRYVQEYLIASVRSAFATLTGLPDVPGNQIEDLQELDRIDVALQALHQLADRQGALEVSQERARETWRDLVAQIRELHGVLPLIEELRTRLQEVEQQLQQRISSEQRNTIYRLVQTYGEARAAQKGMHQPGSEIQKAWREFNARFAIATYTDLPATRFDEATQFVKTQYATLTGRDLESGLQERLL